jgi:hypothetical protein
MGDGLVSGLGMKRFRIKVRICCAFYSSPRLFVHGIDVQSKAAWPIRLKVLNAEMLIVVNIHTSMACTCLGDYRVCVSLRVSVPVEPRNIVFHTTQSCPTLVPSYTRSPMR